jgi:hypothetical protein
MALWLQRHYAHVMACFGGLLLVMAVLAPIVSPADQRSEIAIMTILFGLIGSLMLYKAFASPGGARDGHFDETSQWRMKPARAMRSPGLPQQARQAMQLRRARSARLRAWLGAAFGSLFALAGAVAPFVLGEGNVSADARFMMVIGFAPVVVTGALMLGVFGRQLLANGQVKESSPGPVYQAIEPHRESILTALSTVGISSGLLLVGCAVILPFVVSDADRPGMLTTAALMSVVGISLSLLGVAARRRGLSAMPTVARVTTRRAPVPRVPGSVFYRFIVPAAIGFALLLIVAIIVVVVLATVVPLLN